MVTCQGDIFCGLSDFEIIEVTEYNGKNYAQKPLDDSLVPYLTNEKYEKVADEFLKNHYPEALKITKQGEPPVWVDPIVLAERLKLTVKQQSIRKDSSVFGQIYFEETLAELYDSSLDEDVTVTIPGQTILVDPNMFLLRNLGSVNNIIVHECVHWDQHRKTFFLEKLFNSDVSYISCAVVGGAITDIAKDTTEFMESHANHLAPRIQMPAESFKAKANEYISKYMKITDATHTVDVMEMVITELETAFGVSRQATKIRLVQLDFEEDFGTFNYVDGHYVRPHRACKGTIQLNQTFTLSAQEAAFERFINPELREKTANGDYIFVYNHYVYNTPLYVENRYDGRIAANRLCSFSYG